MSLRFAFDLPMTPARSQALRKMRSNDRAKISLDPIASERVWVYDDKKNTLKVFTKPKSYTERHHKKYMQDLKRLPDSEKWERVIQGAQSPRFLRGFSSEAEDFNEIEWVNLTK